MMTAGEFLERVDAAIDEVAFRLAHTPPDCQDAWLQGFGQRVRDQWRPLFPFPVNGMVDDVIDRVRKRRDAIEAAGAGRA